MILKGPTGPFKNKLPASPSDSGSVTYTISNKEAPNITPVKTLILPEIENIRPAPKLDKNIRNTLGDLIYSITTGAKSSPGSNKKTFEVGELLETTITEVANILSIQVPESINIQHNTNKLDFASMGLTANEVASIEAASISTFETLRTQANSLKRTVENIKISIKENQKNINELNKAIKSLYIVYPNGNSTITKLENTLSTENKTQSDLNFDLNETIKQLNIVYNDIVRLSEVVR